jgi:hypothetical protein
MIIATSSIFNFMSIATLDLVFGIDSYEVVTWNTLNRMINFHF